QRVPAPRPAAAAFRDREPTRELRRIPRIHPRRRLPPARALAERRLGAGAGRLLECAALLERPGGRGAARVHAARRARDRPWRAGQPAQPLRGGGVCAVGRRAPADRVRVGSRGAGARRALRCASLRPVRTAAAGRIGRCERHPAADERRGLGMDPFLVRPLSGLPAPVGHRRRIQRQVHGRPGGAARRKLRDAARPSAGQLPQLLSSGGALAVLRPETGEGRLKSNLLSKLAAVPRTAPDEEDFARTLPPALVDDAQDFLDAGARGDADAPDTEPYAPFESQDPRHDFARELLAALSKRPREISPKFFYDATGSALFDRI